MTMKIVLLLVVAVTSLAWAPAGKADHAVQVQTKISTSHEDPKSGPAEVVVKQMTVILTGSAKSDGEKLTVSTTFYADDLATGQEGVHKQLEASTTLGGGRVEVTLPAVAFEFTPAHAKTSGSGRRVRSVKVPATGKRYHGWVVKVSKGGEVVAQAASHPALLTKE